MLMACGATDAEATPGIPAGPDALGAADGAPGIPGMAEAAGAPLNGTTAGTFSTAGCVVLTTQPKASILIR